MSESIPFNRVLHISVEVGPAHSE